MFLNHQTYEALKGLIGPEATVALANRYGGQTIYFPTIRKEGSAKFYSPWKGLKDKEVRSLICRLRHNAATGEEIINEIQKTWPGDESKRVTRSALYRFFDAVRKGRMREFGIDDMFREINE